MARWAIFAASSSTLSITLENRNFQNCQRSGQRLDGPPYKNSYLKVRDPSRSTVFRDLRYKLQPTSNDPLTCHGYVTVGVLPSSILVHHEGSAEATKSQINPIDHAFTIQACRERVQTQPSTVIFWTRRFPDYSSQKSVDDLMI
jgi:hypothetical protein